MKKLPLGFALILFAILLELAQLNNIWLPVIGAVDVIGLVFGIAGLIFVIAGCSEKKQ